MITLHQLFGGHLEEVGALCDDVAIECASGGAQDEACNESVFRDLTFTSRKGTQRSILKTWLFLVSIYIYIYIYQSIY